MQNQFNENTTSTPGMDVQDTHSAMAEKAVLGGLLRKENTLTILAVLLTEDDFYLHANRLIFCQILLLRKEAKCHDLMAVAEALEISGELNKIGGLRYLNTLITDPPSDANIQHCAIILRERLVSCSVPVQVDEDLHAWARLLSSQSHERIRKNLLKMTCVELAARVIRASDATAAELIDAAIEELIKLKNTPRRGI